MQELVGIVRVEDEMQQALGELKKFWERYQKVRAIGNREYNPGWHTALDLFNLLTVAEAITLSGIERKESRGAQFREDYPTKSDKFAKVNMVVKKGSNGEMQISQVPVTEMPAELKQIIEEMK